MANKQLMMVGGWTSIYEKAKARGFDITVAQDKADLKSADVMLIDRLITSEKSDPALVDLAAALHAVRPFDAVVSFQEQGVMTAALIGQRLSSTRCCKVSSKYKSINRMACATPPRRTATSRAARPWAPRSCW